MLSRKPSDEEEEGPQATVDQGRRVTSILEPNVVDTAAPMRTFNFDRRNIGAEGSSRPCAAGYDTVGSVPTEDPPPGLECHSPRASSEAGCVWGAEGVRMMRVRWEAMRNNQDPWTCFLCCHVRIGTIFIGFWHMLLNLMALSLIAVVVVHPEMLGNQGLQADSSDQLTVEMTSHKYHDPELMAVNCTKEPCILATQGDGHFSNAKNDFSLSYSVGNLLSTHRFNNDEVNVALFITLCTFVVTLLLVYGAFRGQPSHLMPFFFLQVFDFCILSMTMIGYLSYLPNVRQMIRETPVFPFQQQLLSMNGKCLTFFVMLIFITTLMAKAYCISIVWRCYKYLILQAQAGRSVLRYLSGVTGPVDQESQTLVMGQDLPDYDTAVADPQYRKKLSGLFPEPPPSYDMAMAAYYAQAGATLTDSSTLGACGGIAFATTSSAQEGQMDNPRHTLAPPRQQPQQLQVGDCNTTSVPAARLHN
ncbi:uncharacterized protein LOC143027758 isoform X2 [Oratosquilla oratoria]|uniref:uncharacterized protein LOC143027758 isoform X2 n=1 Tax=Oratosquilla oratoria TaxID=337810 RepID=UPI003F76D277